MKHRKNSVARKIQEYFLSKPYEAMFGTGAWCWFAIPNNPEFCVALEWQDGYEGDEMDKEQYGVFMEDTYCINVSIKMTDEFRINGDYALYAETYYTEEGEDLEGGISLTMWDVEEGFYTLSKYLADEFNRYNKMKPKRVI